MERDVLRDRCSCSSSSAAQAHGMSMQRHGGWEHGGGGLEVCFEVALSSSASFAPSHLHSENRTGTHQLACCGHQARHFQAARPQLASRRHRQPRDLNRRRRHQPALQRSPRSAGHPGVIEDHWGRRGCVGGARIERFVKLQNCACHAGPPLLDLARVPALPLFTPRLQTRVPAGAAPQYAPGHHGTGGWRHWRSCGAASQGGTRWCAGSRPARRRGPPSKEAFHTPPRPASLLTLCRPCPPSSRPAASHSGRSKPGAPQAWGRAVAGRRGRRRRAPPPGRLPTRPRLPACCRAERGALQTCATAAKDQSMKASAAEVSTAARLAGSCGQSQPCAAGPGHAWLRCRAANWAGAALLPRQGGAPGSCRSA